MKTIQIYRHAGRAALSFVTGDKSGRTFYLAPETARELLDNLAELVEDLWTREDHTSVFSSTSFPWDDSVPAAPPPAPWYVVSVSTNRDRFGHAGVLVINRHGEGLELTVQAHGDAPLPKRGDKLGILPRSEVPPRRMHQVSPKRAVAIIAELAGEGGVA